MNEQVDALERRIEKLQRLIADLDAKGLADPTLSEFLKEPKQKAAAKLASLKAELAAAKAEDPDVRKILDEIEQASVFLAEHEGHERQPGTFRGLASAYNVVGDNGVTGPFVILPGAFASAVRDSSHVRLLREHDRNRVVGTITKLEEDDKGLWVEAKFADTPEGKEVAELVRSGALPELSVNFTPKKVTNETRNGRKVRVIHEASDLVDVSVVAWGANPKARVAEAASRQSRGERMNSNHVRSALAEIERQYAEIVGTIPERKVQAPTVDFFCGRPLTLAEQSQREESARSERFQKALQKHPEWHRMPVRQLQTLIETEHEAVVLSSGAGSRMVLTDSLIEEE